MPRRAAVPQCPDQCWMAVQVARQLWKANRIVRKAGHYFLADLPDRSLVVAQKERANFLFTGRTALLARADECHLASDVLAQQLVRFEQVVLVILLDDTKRSGFGQRTEVDGRGVDGCRDVHELQVEAPGRKPKITNVPHQGDA